MPAPSCMTSLHLLTRSELPLYGVVVDSVNVSVLLYAPVRSASPALMCCLNPRHASLDRAV